MDILETSDDWSLKTTAAKNLLEKFGIHNAQIKEITSNEDEPDVILYYREERQGFLSQIFYGRHENNVTVKTVKRADLVSEMKLQEVMWMKRKNRS